MNWHEAERRRLDGKDFAHQVGRKHGIQTSAKEFSKICNLRYIITS
jgi:hypothetical protein